MCVCRVCTVCILCVCCVYVVCELCAYCVCAVCVIEKTQREREGKRVSGRQTPKAVSSQRLLELAAGT